MKIKQFNAYNKENKYKKGKPKNDTKMERDIEEISN